MLLCLKKACLAAIACGPHQPLQKDRGEILRALLAANGGKMLDKEARQKMHLDRATFTRLMPKMKDYIEVRPYRLKKNQKLLVLKSKLVEFNKINGLSFDLWMSYNPV